MLFGGWACGSSVNVEHVQEPGSIPKIQESLTTTGNATTPHKEKVFLNIYNISNT